MTSVVLEKASKIYPGSVHAVRDLDLHVKEGEFFVLLGPSGCGKTTVLRMVAGLESLTSGECWLGGQRASDLPPRDRDIGMVFQDSALYPHLNVYGNLAFPLEVAGSQPEIIDRRVRELAMSLEIQKLLDRSVARLSGGERQRVAMGRAVVGEPSLFLMDEPLSNLDAGMRTELRLEIGRLARQLDITTIYVTHDQVEALSLADRVAILRHGKVEDVGTPAQVYSDPATAFVATFLSSLPVNLVAAHVWVSRGEPVVLDFGSQLLRLPVLDQRSEIVSRFAGQTIIVGIRPDVMDPVGGPGAGTLSGRIRGLEYHGHEWIAYLDMGVTAVTMERIDKGQMVPPPRQQGPRVGRRTAGRRSGNKEHFDEFWMNRQGSTDLPSSSGSHRRTDLLVRSKEPRVYHVGDTLDVAVDPRRLLLFNRNGQRIDSVIR